MKTLSDYHKKVLGITLDGKSVATDEATHKELLQTDAGPFCFLCHQEDFEANKDLVLKILKAANSTQEIVVFDSAHTTNFKDVFTFDLPKEEALNFESFSEISKNPSLKKRLWGELKKRSAS